MDNEPFFPAPRAKKEQRGYREPARALEAGEGTSSSSATTDPQPKRIIVKRPDADPADPAWYTDGSRYGLSPEDGGPLESERSFWNRHSFVQRHPRLTGAGLTAAAGILVCAGLGTRHHGGAYGALAPVMLSWGIFLLFAGYPRDLQGRTPFWWAVGIFFATLLGAAAGVVLLASLRY